MVISEMALKILRKVSGLAQRPQFIGQISCRSYSLYEPDYLESGKSKIPLHDTLNIEFKAYNFPVLEKYQQFVHNLADNIGLEVETGWALPPQEMHVHRLRPQSTVIEAEYRLKMYKRIVQITDPPSTIYPIFLRLIEASLPEGVTLHVYKHENEHEEYRYVPDRELIDLKSQLETYHQPIKKK